MRGKNWNTAAKRLLKSELAKRGISYSKLVELLACIEVIETKASIESKISRGSFSAAFLLQCLLAIDCNVLSLDNRPLLKEDI